MKKNLLFLSFLFVVFQLECSAKDKIVTLNELPIKAQKFLKAHFTSQKVSAVKLDSELFEKNYEVLLINGTKIEFDAKGNWIKVDCKSNAVPSTIIPQKILNYVLTTYPEHKIIKIELEHKIFEIKLINGLELKFNNKGKFIGLD